MLVDDEDGVVQVLGNRLKRRNFEICTATSAEHAIETAIERRPDLIILDVNLNGISGFHVLDQIRNGGLVVPVIFMSGFSREDVGESHFDEMTRFIEKPLDFDVLLSTIQDMIANQKPHV